MTQLKDCTVCKISIDGSLKIHQIGNGFYICQSCRKTYYTIWRKVFELVFLEIHGYLKEQQQNCQPTPFLGASLPYATCTSTHILLPALDIPIITEMIYKILNSDRFTEECLKSYKFEFLDSYEKCSIQASDYAINLRHNSLKRKLNNKRINHKLNLKCGFCRFKFILFKFKEIPRMKIVMTDLERYQPDEILFLKGLQEEGIKANNVKTSGTKGKIKETKADEIVIQSNSLKVLYNKKMEFLDELVKINEREKKNILPKVTVSEFKNLIGSASMNFQAQNTGVPLGNGQNTLMDTSGLRANSLTSQNPTMANGQESLLNMSSLGPNSLTSQTADKTLISSVNSGQTNISSLRRKSVTQQTMMSLFDKSEINLPGQPGSSLSLQSDSRSMSLSGHQETSMLGSGNLGILPQTLNSGMASTSNFNVGMQNLGMSSIAALSQAPFSMGHQTNEIRDQMPSLNLSSATLTPQTLTPHTMMSAAMSVSDFPLNNNAMISFSGSYGIDMPAIKKSRPDNDHRGKSLSVQTEHHKVIKFFH